MMRRGITVLFMVLWCLVSLITAADLTACLPGPTTPREEIVFSNVQEFEIDDKNIQIIGGDHVDANEKLAGATVRLRVKYEPRALIPYHHNSSVYLWFTGNNGNDVVGSECGFYFQHDHGYTDGNNTLPQLYNEFDVPIGCLSVDTSSTPLSWPLLFETNIEIWYCYNRPNECSGIMPIDVGFDSTNPLSLFDKPLCQGALVYKMMLSVQFSTLDDTMNFYLDYIRDEVRTTDPFLAVTGQKSLSSPIDWSICDQAEDGTIAYDDCIARMNPSGGAKRVIKLSLPDRDPRPINLVFGLTDDDVNLVNADHELTIDVEKSHVWLYHYPNNPYAIDSTVKTCNLLEGCTDASQFAQLTPTSDIDTGFTKMKLQLNMPEYRSNYRCDEGYCVLVLKLNFKSANSMVSRRELDIYFDSTMATPKFYAKSGKPATQGMKIGVENPDILYIHQERVVYQSDPTMFIVTGVCGLVIGLVIVCCYRAYRKHKKKRKNDIPTTNQPQPHRTSPPPEENTPQTSSSVSSTVIDNNAMLKKRSFVLTSIDTIMNKSHQSIINLSTRHSNSANQSYSSIPIDNYCETPNQSPSPSIHRAFPASVKRPFPSRPAIKHHRTME